jgi:ATP synthase protein I
VPVSAKAPPPVKRDPSQPRGEHAGYQVLSYMITGMAVYGAVGWLIGRWTAISVLFPIGMLAGLACGIALVIFRFGRN